MSAPASWWRSLEARVALTVGALVLYNAGRRLSLPGLDPQALAELWAAMGSTGGSLAALAANSRVSPLGLGVLPFLTAFLVVELAALVLPAARDLRAGGPAGRRKLNTAAVLAGLLLATVQAAALVVFLEQQSSPSGAAIVPQPGTTFRLLTVLTLVAGTAGSFGLAQVITRFGFGNGLGWLIGAGAVEPLFLSVAGRLSGREPEAPWLGLELLLLLVAGWATIYLFRQGRETRRITRGDREVELLLPAFPQSVMPAQWAQGMAGIFWTLAGSGLFLRNLLPPETSRHLAFALTVLPVPLLGLATFLLLCGDAVLERRLNGVVAERRRLAAFLLNPSNWALTGFTLAFAWFAWYPEHTFLNGWGYVQLVVAVAILLDLGAEARLRLKHRDLVPLLELDNVILASHLEGELAGQGISALARGYHLRSLFFLFQPALKIDLLVPEAELERAHELVAPHTSGQI